MIEAEGIPTMIITRGGFSQVCANAFTGVGFAPEAPTVHEFPIPMFAGPGTDLTPLKEDIDKVVYGLTKWEPEIKETGIYYPAENVKAEGKDWEDAFGNLNLLFLSNMWSDGLPIRPPTAELVDWILTGTDRDPDEVIGKLFARGGIGTPKSLAVCLAMAGGRPEYMPLLLASLEAMVPEEWRFFHANTTTNAPYPVLMVNGPIAKQIRLNSGYGLLGPDSRHPAGGAIGRAIRLAQICLAGATPGIGTMSLYGQNRWANAVFAEDEDGLPEGWLPLSAEPERGGFGGFPIGSNVVTAISCCGGWNVGGGATTNEEVALQKLWNWAGFLRTPSSNIMTPHDLEDMAVGAILMARGTAQGLADLGWSKLDVKTFMWENSKWPWEELVRCGLTEKAMEDGGISEGEPFPLTARPDQLMLVVCGGVQSGHNYWLPGGGGEIVISKEIELPTNWDDLLVQAEEDLGPLPAD